MSYPRWSLRKSGEVRTTVRVNYHVPKAIVDWMQEHNPRLTTIEAMRWIKEHMHELTDDWKILAIDPDGDMLTISVDDIDSATSEGYNVYEGPHIVWG